MIAAGDALFEGMEMHFAAALFCARLHIDVDQKTFERSQQKRTKTSARRIRVGMPRVFYELGEEFLGQILDGIHPVSARADKGEHRRAIGAAQGFQRCARIGAVAAGEEHHTPLR